MQPYRPLPLCVNVTGPEARQIYATTPDLTESKTNDHDAAFDGFIQAAKQASGDNGNLISYGVRASAAVDSFNNGSFLYMTYIGTVESAEW